MDLYANRSDYALRLPGDWEELPTEDLLELLETPCVAGGFGQREINALESELIARGYEGGQ